MGGDVLITSVLHAGLVVKPDFSVRPNGTMVNLVRD
jgi:hypothetical protein